MLRAGFATVDITPPIGTRLSGFAGRPTADFASTGVRDLLHADALWLEDGQHGALLIALDTIGLDPHDDGAWRRALAGTLNCAPEAIFLACSHTHSGAATMTIRATGDKARSWTRTLLARITEAARAARAGALPLTTATTGAAPCVAMVNRRDSNGPRDPRVRTLTLNTAAGPLVTVFHVACHPVALGNQNTAFSADWVATARASAEAHLGCPALFLQGCCGDINPRFLPGPRSPEQAERVGSEIAAAVGTAVAGSHPIALGPVRWGHARALLPLLPYPDAAALAAVETQSLAQLVARGCSDIDQGFCEWVDAVRQKPGRRRRVAVVSALQLGELTLLGLPGEIFTEIGLALDPAWPVGFTNGNLGYLYPDSAMAVGGYEVEVAYRLYGEQQLAPGAAEALLRGARRALQRAQSM